MGLLAKAVDVVETTMEMISRYMIGRDLASYCDLVTAIGISDDDLREFPDEKDPHILVNKQNAMLTVFDVQGTFRLTSEREFEEIVGNLRMRIGSYMRSFGHSLSFCFERDPDRSYDELMRLAESQLNTARRIGIEASDIVMSRVERNAPLVAWEQNLLVVYTHMSAMSSEEQKRVIAERAAQAKQNNLPPMRHGQSPSSVLHALKFRHDSFVERIVDDLLKSGPGGEGGILITRLSAHDAARAVRIQLDREHTSQKWRPVLPGDRVTAHGYPREGDYSDVSLPKLNFQIATHDVEPIGDFVKTDALYHCAMSMELGPQEPKPFQSFMEKLNRSLPWRIRFDLEPGGLAKSRGKRSTLSFVGMFPGNKQILESFRELVAIDDEDPVCTLRVVASTWGATEAQMKERRAALEKAMQSWGVCQVRSSHGDPILALGSSIAAFSTANVANMLFPPLSDSLSLMPFQRPATPWARDGSFVQRTPEGKIYPIGLASRLQDVDLRVITATPGSGKSVMLNSMNFANLLRPGVRRLPLMTIMDVGMSSTGLVEMVRDGLPEARKNEAVAIRLSNDKRFAVNPFDTQLGALAPTRSEMDFLVDLLGGMLMNTQTLKPPAADAGNLCSHLLRNTYAKKMGPEATPYERGVDSGVDAALDADGLREMHDNAWWEDATWMEVRDLLFTHGKRREATLAHFRAMPTLPDLAACLNDKDIAELYSSALTDTGEALTKYAERAFAAAAERYGLFAGRTRFEVSSETRILCLDLQEVIGSATTNDGLLRTSMMYLFARNLGARNYFLVEDELMDVLPKDRLYHEYHMERIVDIKDEIKTLAYDELHNLGKPEKGLTLVMDRLKKDALEVRKWGVSVIGSSQYLEHFPADLLNAATSVYVMRGGNASDEAILREKFKVSDECIRRLNREATGPGPQGGNYLALFKTKVGTIVQMLTNTPGPVELWAFSTTPEDMALRRRLFQAIGPSAARTFLAKRFKSGSATTLIDAMRLEARPDEAESVLDKLARTLLDEYRSDTAARLTQEALT
jgi:intracellular multiplication protein IcmB